jgi:hypothetical protein
MILAIRITPLIIPLVNARQHERACSSDATRINIGDKSLKVIKAGANKAFSFRK